MPLFVLAGSLMGRSGEAGVAATAASAARHNDALVGMREVVHQLACDLVVNDRADRHFQHDAFALASGLVGALAVASALSLVFGIEAEVHQRVVALAGLHDDVATASAIAARRKAMQPLPPSPAFIRILASSTNISD